MPRPKKYIKQVRREIYLPEEIATVLDTMFLDPLSGRARYGCINTYINSLVRQDLTGRGLLGKRPLDSGDNPSYNNGNIAPIFQEET